MHPRATDHLLRFLTSTLISVNNRNKRYFHQTKAAQNESPPQIESHSREANTGISAVVGAAACYVALLGLSWPRPLWALPPAFSAGPLSTDVCLPCGVVLFTHLSYCVMLPSLSFGSFLHWLGGFLQNSHLHEFHSC